MLEKVKIGVFVMGGIAAYKVPELVRQLIKKGAQVQVAMTQSAQEFVTPLTLQVLTKRPVLTHTFDEREPSQVQHVAMADWCDLALVVPATANGLAKMAHGLADDVVTTTLLAVTAPILVVPAMNVHMYENPATQRNLAQLRADGLTIMEPDTGFLAEGYEGKGRLPELHRIVAQVERLYARTHLPQSLAGKQVIVSAGGTRERIDPVRYISNDSSGKMGYAMAQAADWLGATVTLVSTTHSLLPPEGVQVQEVASAQELAQAMTSHYDQMDYVVMAAAVSDYRVKYPHDQKIKKVAGQTDWQLDLVANPDILAQLGQTKRQQVLIGFAAETQNLLEHARAKLSKKGADWLIANDVSNPAIGFNSDKNQVYVLGAQGQEVLLPQQSKTSLALAAWQVILAEGEETL
ncbi:bifunctional phosphopantothenoylcysteine decarboxylase/phosphopantothenate--cysteine ligase CoaBC [Abiotrophia defectiva]|uniref:Coenzyme A biosynthesis bifunctional protein CoaBC n=1 Tax=Abiotrophia defectiva ATCC 49176 TaxID=592010 RepID=W1Q3K1_ABIDE|nr:bifunctional phosphopantothenoylcysteine decarboxylase/phosphopantothenate--cysteine ligase CoaBC [Abiotrophia defectiva]ESK65721.1 phosphopantothenoylcysteine decarboxylase/phosphopantothenate--cysteine ligase [Abiotrophia defectiva ATCC 49176]QKH46699.1 bifunctional phosphopantothenoylcysteine decarboxylase/phosphopantothenate--cysteine ligase CoaBC [Abiotrophia defectiva]